MTSAHHRSGTDRISEVAARLDYERVVNVQSDEPLLDPETIDGVLEVLEGDEAILMSTAAERINSWEDMGDPNIVKVVLDRSGCACYFSRAPIPFIRSESEFEQHRPLRHIGLYAYRRDFLIRFSRMAPGLLEQIEGLEQLRALENGWDIAVVETPPGAIGVDTWEDLAQVRRRIAAQEHLAGRTP